MPPISSSANPFASSAGASACNGNNSAQAGGQKMAKSPSFADFTKAYNNFVGLPSSVAGQAVNFGGSNQLGVG